MNVYAEQGGSFQQVGGECPEGWIVMAGQRPAPEHIAAESGEWVLPPETVEIPQSVSRWQGREAMRLTPYGTPTDGVSLFDAAVERLNRPETPEYYRTAWDELQEFEFDSPMLIAIADELGLTYDDRVALFLFAVSLRA
jgi:hypothetical protein